MRRMSYEVSHFFFSNQTYKQLPHYFKIDPVVDYHNLQYSSNQKAKNLNVLRVQAYTVKLVKLANSEIVPAEWIHTCLKLLTS